MKITDKAVEAFIETYKLECDHRYDPDAINAALTAALPHMGGVKVRPLEWHGPDVNGENRAHSILCVYTIRAAQGSLGYWLTEVGGYFPDSEAAKAAAQADYERRILSAIEHPQAPQASPAPDELEVVAYRTPYFENNKDGRLVPVVVPAPVITGEGWEPLVRLTNAQAALTACQQEVERLRAASIASGNALYEARVRNAELVKALEWYGEQARLARLIHSGGDSGRHALAGDGGKRARAALKGQSNEHD